MRRPPFKPGRYLDPLSDFGFKYLFGQEPNKDILISFLNVLFEGEKEIVDITYSPTEHGGETEYSKRIFFDLLCTGPNGEQFIVEMQRAEQRNFADRAVFYTSRVIADQLPRGASHWNVDLKEVYLIAILEFNFANRQSQHYLHNVSLVNTTTGDIFYNKLGYKFLELPNFVKAEAEIETDLDRWFFLLKNMSHLDKIPAVLNKRIFQKIFKIAEIGKLTKEDRAMYDSNLKARWDYENSIAFAEEKAEERAEKRAEINLRNNNLNIARQLKQRGMADIEISIITGLSIEDMEKL